MENKTGRSNWWGNPSRLVAKKKDFYKTAAEASEAARALGIKSWKDYVGEYKKDPRLPSSPLRHYFILKWKDFIGK